MKLAWLFCAMICVCGALAMDKDVAGVQAQETEMNEHSKMIELEEAKELVEGDAAATTKTTTVDQSITAKSPLVAGQDALNERIGRESPDELKNESERNGKQEVVVEPLEIDDNEGIKIEVESQEDTRPTIEVAVDLAKEAETRKQAVDEASTTEAEAKNGGDIEEKLTDSYVGLDDAEESRYESVLYDADEESKNVEDVSYEIDMDEGTEEEEESWRSLEDTDSVKGDLADLLPHLMSLERSTLPHGAENDDDDDDDYFDFVIVGAGPAGSALANRLSEVEGWRVLLLEAGSEEVPIMSVPFLAGSFHATDANWNFVTVPQHYACRRLRGRRCDYTQGRAVGGGSVINYMLNVRGNRHDFDAWQAAGNVGWGYDSVLPYFRKAECMQVPELRSSSFHGTSGHVKVNYPPYQSEISKAVARAYEEAGFAQLDYSGGAQTGVSRVQTTTAHGVRWSAARAYLHPARHRANLVVRPRSFVTRVLIDEDARAYGVRYRHGGLLREAYAALEVIVTAGAVNSPKLLMLSGIGPRGTLESLGIRVVSDLLVGFNLQDQVVFPFLHVRLRNESVAPTVKQILTNARTYTAFLLGRDGPLTTPAGFETVSFSELPGTPYYAPDWPPIEVLHKSFPWLAAHATAHALRVPWRAYRRVLRPLNRCATWLPMVVQMRPQSRGRVWLRSADPTAPPLIDPRALSHQEDARQLLAGIKEVVRLLKTETLRELGAFLHRTRLPGCEKFHFGSDRYWMCAIRGYAMTFFNPVGTNKMGPDNDPAAVVTADLRVRGVTGLRVADSSVIPTIVSGQTQAITYVIAERAADIIKATYGQLNGSRHFDRPCEPASVDHFFPFEKPHHHYHHHEHYDSNENHQYEDHQNGMHHQTEVHHGDHHDAKPHHNLDIHQHTDHHDDTKPHHASHVHHHANHHDDSKHHHSPDLHHHHDHHDDTKPHHASHVHHHANHHDDSKPHHSPDLHHHHDHHDDTKPHHASHVHHHANHHDDSKPHHSPDLHHHHDHHDDTKPHHASHVHHHANHHDDSKPHHSPDLHHHHDHHDDAKPQHTPSLHHADYHEDAKPHHTPDVHHHADHHDDAKPHVLNSHSGSDPHKKTKPKVSVHHLSDHRDSTKFHHGSSSYQQNIHNYDTKPNHQPILAEASDKHDIEKLHSEPCVSNHVAKPHHESNLNSHVDHGSEPSDLSSENHLNHQKKKKPSHVFTTETESLHHTDAIPTELLSSDVQDDHHVENNPLYLASSSIQNGHKKGKPGKGSTSKPVSEDKNFEIFLVGSYNNVDENPSSAASSHSPLEHHIEKPPSDALSLIDHHDSHKPENPHSASTLHPHVDNHNGEISTNEYSTDNFYDYHEEGQSFSDYER